MTRRHLVMLVEEPSMEAFLRSLLARKLPADCDFEIHPFQGKADLLDKLPARLRGYSSWLPKDWRIIVVVDRDDEDCKPLKNRLEAIAKAAGLQTRTQARNRPWQVVNRIAIEELEAWYFGNWPAVRRAYPRVSANIPSQASHRDPDAIRGGTWEAFERVLNRFGYYKAGMPKIEVARAIAAELDVAENRSPSFSAFLSALNEAAQ